MAEKVFVKKIPAIDAIVAVLILAIIILISGCLGDKSASGAPNNQTLQNQIQTETDSGKVPIERVAGELNMLHSKDWGKLVEKLGRSRSVALLWYHLKTTYGVDTKVVFGNPKKLDAALAIMVQSGGESSFPKVSIKGVNYYIIDPMTPAIIGEFKYGDIFDDPGNTYLSYSYFRLYPEDVDIIKAWMQETGVDLKYTDFPGK